MSGGDGQKALAPQQVIDSSVQVVGDVTAPIFLRFAEVGARITPWWSLQRDKELREFWRTEPVLASAIYTVASRQAAFSWALDGPSRACNRVQDILLNADLGAGWVSFIEKGSQELATQDNGWFLEVIRPKNGGPETAPIGIAHLDSGACIRTGDPEEPVLYIDRKGGRHLLKWYQVVILEELPSPIQTMNGVGFCAVSRVLKAAMILKDIATFKEEKVSSRPQRGIWFVQGMRQSVIEDALKKAMESQESEGLTRFVKPIVAASLDPAIPINVHQLDFASLPDGFDEETTLRWYIAQLAMGFGTDYQEFAPMPGQKLGAGAQAEVMAQKARGKGPALFMKRLEHALNLWVCPQSVTFQFVETDPVEEKAKADVALVRAMERRNRIESMEITPAEARQLALDAGDLPPEMVEKDVTEETVATDIEEAPTEEERPGEVETEEPLGGEEVSAKAKKGFPTKGRIRSTDISKHPADDLMRAFADGLQEWLGELQKELVPSLWKEYQRRPRGLLQRMLGRKQAGLLDDEELWRRIQDDGYKVVFKFISDGARRGYKAAEEMLLNIGIVIDFETTNPLVLEAIEEHALNLVRLDGPESVVRSTRDQLREMMTRFYEAPDVAENDFVAALESLFGRDRAERIAITEMTNVYTASGIETAIAEAQRLGLDLGYEVYTVADDRVCEECEAAEAGGPYPFDDDEHKPAIHPTCRCNYGIVRRD